MDAQGFCSDFFDGRLVIGIADTLSKLAPCNRHLHEFSKDVRRAVLMAVGFPLHFPVISIGELLMRPTTMKFRNLAAMDFN